MNRFENWLKKSRWNKYKMIGAALGLFLVLDGLAQFTIVWLGIRPYDQFIFTRPFADRPWADILGLTYLGFDNSQEPWIEAQWFPADGLLGWRLAHSVVIRRGWLPNKKEGEWKFTNSQGFPTSGKKEFFYEHTKPPGVYRVIILGGSTVEGYGAGTPFENLPSNLQRALQAAAPPGTTVEVINGGVGGYSSGQEYLFLLSDLADFHPDLVIAYDGANDGDIVTVNYASDNRTGFYRFSTNETNADIVNESFTVSGALSLDAQAIMNRTVVALDGFATFHVLRRLILEISLREAFTRGGPDLTAAADQTAAEFIQNRERMAFLAKQRGFAFASIIQPIMGVDGKTYTSTERAYLSKVSEYDLHRRTLFYDAVRKRLSSLDMCNADISDTVLHDVTDTVYSDTAHLLPDGNRIVAERIVAELKRCGLLFGPHG